MFVVENAMEPLTIKSANSIYVRTFRRPTAILDRVICEQSVDPLP
jgi:hypothetical protein